MKGIFLEYQAQACFIRKTCDAQDAAFPTFLSAASALLLYGLPPVTAAHLHTHAIMMPCTLTSPACLFL